jgi:hypothetical protein
MTYSTKVTTTTTIQCVNRKYAKFYYMVRLDLYSKLWNNYNLWDTTPTPSAKSGLHLPQHQGVGSIMSPRLST